MGVMGKTPLRGVLKVSDEFAREGREKMSSDWCSMEGVLKMGLWGKTL